MVKHGKARHPAARDIAPIFLRKPNLIYQKATVNHGKVRHSAAHDIAPIFLKTPNQI
ncbi:hypothetical protein T4E_11196 [Trichinella pseudospiralis]|uniref:Uncharacterized protein n=1 Tax=Trichinella pseudospiralis TaxID=6337 RepID=A0A0V0XDY2_TRIPS|nr:hypothetical protein T4E_11196 [Trichinella pseudospiralis]